MKTICEVANAPIAITNSSAANVTMRPVRCSPSATASSLGAPLSCTSLMRAEQEDAVVGREPEGDREQQHRLRGLDRALAGEAEQPLEWPSWKTSTSRPNAALSVSRFITSALTGSTTEPVIRNRMTSVVRREDRERERQVVARAPPAGRGTPPSGRRPRTGERRRHRADVAHELLGRLAERPSAGRRGRSSAARSCTRGGADHAGQPPSRARVRAQRPRRGAPRAAT